MTTIAGQSPMAAVSGTQCPNLPTGRVSTDVYGDGCLAVNAVLGASGRGGVQVDAFGNVFIDDDVNSIVHVVNPQTGIMTVLAGKGSVCAGKLDAAGDGCIAATQTLTAGQRGVGIDPYGNVLLGGYSDNLVHIICRTASPNCTSAQIGTMQLVAGCSTGTGSNGTGGLGSSNTIAFKTAAGTCTAALGEVAAPRGAAGDIYGNIYYADTNNSRYRVVLGPQTSSYFTGTNPLYAALGVVYPSLTAGFVYTVINTTGTCNGTYTAGCGGTATTKNNACSVTTNSVTYSGTALTTYGDGCPFNFSSVITSSGYTSGLAVDAAGNLIIADPTNGLRVLYINGTGTAGTLMKNAIMVNNTSIGTPKVGFVYDLIGGGAAGLTAAPALGSTITGTAQSASTTGAFDSSANKVQVSPQGNIYIGDSTKIIFFDIYTGYARTLITAGTNVTAGNFCTGTSGQKSLSAYSDGCPVAQSGFTNGNGLGITADAQDNIYLYDATPASAGMLVRKVLAQSSTPRILSTPLIQIYRAHFLESAAGTLAATATLSGTSEYTVGAATCAAQNADNSFDCTATVTSTPAAAGIRSATLTFTGAFTPATGTASSSVVDFSLGGISSGSELAFDNASSTAAGTTTPIAPTTNAIFSGITPAGAAVDGAGNVYTMDTAGGHFLESIGGVTYTLPGTLPTTPSQLAVDQLGNVYAVGSGTSSITELAVNVAGTPSTYTATSLAYTPVSGTAAPTAVAVDSSGNIYVADKQASTANTGIYRISTLPGSAQSQVTIATGFTNPASLAVDPAGNIYVADKGANAVYKLTPATTGIVTYTQTTVTTGATAPVAVATDPAGNLYVQDSGTAQILEVPLSGAITPVLAGLTTPNGLAVDGSGAAFSSDAAKTSLTQVVRNAVAFNFGTNEAITFAGNLSDVGNVAATGQATGSGINTTNFSVTGGTSNGCGFTSNILGAVPVGNACTLSAMLIGNGSGTVTDTVTFIPVPTLGSLTLTGTLQGVAIGTTTTIAGPTPSSPVYSATGTEATFVVSVAAASGSAAPGGTVAVTIDSTTTSYTLVAGAGTTSTANVALSGLAAGTHTISAAYATSGSFSASNSGAAQSFTIAQATTTTTFNPSTTTQQYSAAVGAGVLNATAVLTGTSTSVPGFYLYTATPSGGSPATIHSASYLPIGTYSLGVTFVPTDSADYGSSTATVATYTVTKANTTATLGATNNLVAADGTGNFTSIQAAVNTIPATGGGNIYIKPGTYSENVAVVQPNVSLRGLGGDPNGVILTHVAGSFGGTGTYAYAGEFTTALTNGYQLPAGSTRFNGDEGSATIVVARGINTAVSGSTLTPNNFFADNMTFRNTYNTDTTLTTTYVTGGNCTANAGPAMAYNVLFSAGTQCASQALAIWITSDLAVMNNVNFTSGQDTIYNGSQGGSPYVPARQYYFRGKVTGVVDYIFGDSASVFDYSSIYTANRTTATVEAQNKAIRTGAAGDYLSADIMNSNVFTSFSTGQNNLYFGRPYGVYSTYIMLNSYVDQVNPAGYEEFSGNTNLPTSTYGEYNTMTYTDPATGSNDLNGVPYIGNGGNTGQGVTGTRENTSQNPGTPQAANAIKTLLTAAQATQYYPTNFLSTTVTNSSTGVTNWNPTAAIANSVNAFATAGTTTNIAGGSSVTILMRPQTPGIGAITNGTYTIPTGTYTLTDTFNSATTTLASGSLDASGEAYFITSTLAPGTHSLSWTYGGDSNFNGSTVASAYTITVAPYVTTTTLGITTNPITYGQAAQITATVSSANGTPAGNATLYVDGVANGTQALSGGATTFTVTGLQAGSHSVYATFAANSTYGASTSGTMTLTVNKAQITVTGIGANRRFNQPNALSFTVSGYQYTDSASTVFSAGPTVSSTSTRDSVAGTYTAVPAATLSAFGNTNYTLVLTPGNFTVTGGDPQNILFAPLPNFPNGGTYQLTARTTSGLPVTYAVTAGNATVTGTALTVTGPGTVSVQATTAADATGDYTTATPVTRSFTAQ